MYSSLHIKGYRGLADFQLEGLGRVNLLVGTNNSGKTSILECIELLGSSGGTYVISSILGRRGEWGYPVDDNRPPPGDISHLFSNRNFDEKISIVGKRTRHTRNANLIDSVSLSIENAPIEELDFEELDFQDDEILEEDERLVLTVNWSNLEDTLRIGVTPEGYVSLPRRSYRSTVDFSGPIQFIRTNGVTAQDTMRLFDEIVLTENEEHVTQALRVIEPAIERIASVGIERRPFHRESPSGIFLKLAYVTQRIPIGSAGDGMWRMLGLALALANAKGGIVLVDEIDTGLHYSVMKDMWRMVNERATKLDVQVFATTHSRDCYESLAAIVQPNSRRRDVTIQRIESNSSRAITISDDEIIATADRGIEFR